MPTFEMKVTVILSAVFAARIFQLAASSDRCTTTTQYGLVRGKPMTSRNGREFCAFLGIPYAAPPIGKLRFMPPLYPTSWEGVKDSTEESDKCLQKEPGGSEDCLYLNVFTHSTNSSSSFPVMVFIHGGGFFMGSSSLGWTGPEYLMEKDILLVIIQYRLGPFGFLSTEDTVVPGNMGLKDQVKALQWVRDNIESFGGDKDKVTIFGNSAGSASVHYHMMSPTSQSLFSRAISQSGTAVSSFALIGKGKAKRDTEKLADKLNCFSTSSEEILNCLQDKTATELLQQFLKLLKSKYGQSDKLFRPVVEVNTEHAFLTKHPLTFTTHKPWLVGLNAKEGLWRVDQRVNNTINYIETDFENFGPFMTQFADLYSNLDEIMNQTYQFYFENPKSTEDLAMSLEQLTTDTWFAWPTELAITHHQGPLYYYLYDHLARYTYSQMYHIEPIHRGAIHTDELLMLFTQNGTFPPVTGEDLNISELIVDLWTNFATNGSPTPTPVSSNPQDDSAENITWTESGNSDPTFFHIQTNKLSMETNLFPERMRFWRRVEFHRVE
ncbi:juvenile hormone esterase-like [Macrosteles quadrilineatus]|uniref:juvenile hormone esterase-like n=1 Tax=Macrosteles quadrilineatus TaxID=74068 RepID=UPI0023E24DF2|nr:juvenile hormone esterase-like [Macrosteles quadrilineatus]